ncbi:MAG: SIS domain-containing protein [Kiloniellales bacterium]|nr:SIS domain-containing protein [Kiloniellales bacterium]
MNKSLLRKISQELTHMASAERRVGEAVLHEPSDVINMSMASLASRCRVSDPTIVRFFRRFDFDSYNEFKVRLAQDLVPMAPFEYQKILSTDDVASVVHKTCHNSLNAVQRALEDLNVAEIEAAAAALVEARWIGILASGISEITATDAEHKFSRLGLRCATIFSETRQKSVAESMREGEVFLIFSQSGATRPLVETARITARNGARTIAITAPESPLARESELVVSVTPYEHTELLTPLASRLNHQLLVNILVTVMAIKSGNEFPDQLPALDSWITEKI